VAESLSVDPSNFRLSFDVLSAEFSVSDFLYSRLATNHQQQLDTLFEQGLIRVDGECVTSTHKLQPGQKVEVTLPDHQEEPVDTQWYKLWENDELMAVHKPHLLPVSRTTRNLYNTLISLIRRQTPYATAHLLHRLDAETSGIVLIAKTAAADKKWKPQLGQLITRKVYQAWVFGNPNWDKKILDCELSEKNDSPIRSQVYVVDQARSELYPKPKQSKTAFRVLQREGSRSLIECELYTGRKHQIRVHLAHLGYPIIGDKIYALSGQFYLKRLKAPLQSDDFNKLGSEYQLLEASRLGLNIDDERVEIETASPEMLSYSKEQAFKKL